MPLTEWQGCYDGSWRGAIVPEAFAHPAKMSRALVARIFDELFAMGAISRGSVVVDPFGGIGTTAIEGTFRGVRVYCHELESKFVGLAQQNFALHAELWKASGKTPPVIVQGDSRRLVSSLGPVLASAIVSSPPYAGDSGKADRTGHQRAARRAEATGYRQGLGCFKTSEAYGDTPGQLGAMESACGVDAIVSSPPFASGDSASAQSITTRSDKSAAWVKANCGSAATQGYGASDGQLGVMAMGKVADALVSSPPYENDTVNARNGIDMSKTRVGSRPGGPSSQANTAHGYGQADGQLGNAAGDTFWSAAHDIVRESYAILKPGGIAVWVVKHFVRNKQIVDFPGDWRRLCEHVGFETIAEVHASLVHEQTRRDLFGVDTTTRRERKSFFRRLAEKKGSPRIDFETVYFMRTPSPDSDESDAPTECFVCGRPIGGGSICGPCEALESPPAADAPDPHAGSTGNLSTRV